MSYYRTIRIIVYRVCEYQRYYQMCPILTMGNGRAGNECIIRRSEKTYYRGLTSQYRAPRIGRRANRIIIGLWS